MFAMYCQLMWVIYKIYYEMGYMTMTMTSQTMLEENLVCLFIFINS